MTGIVVALGATSFVVASASTDEAEAAATDCWDEYTLSGTAIQRVITPKGVAISACTVPTACLDGYNNGGSVPTRLYVPRGRPKSMCSPVPPTTTTTTTTTTTAPPPAPPPPPPPPTTAATTTTTTTTTTAPPPPPPPPPPGGSFVASFDTAADFYDRFDTYTGNYCDFGTACRPEDISAGVAQFPGSHSTACAAPPSTRTVNISTHSNLFWWCAPGGAATGHLMSGLNGSGYSLVSFAPKQSFTNVNQVCWDVSLADLGGGKWFNVVLVPEATYLSHPNTNPRRVQDGEGPYRLDYVTPDFIDGNGPGLFNIQNLGSGAGAIVGVKQFRGMTQIYRGTSQLYDDQQAGSVWTAGADESTRFRHCFRDNGNGTITYEQNRSSGVKQVTTAGAFPNGAVRVLFQDDTYDADKHGGTGRYTWHWDNITIE